MVAPRFKVGELIFSRVDIYNDDGSVFDVEGGALLARAGTGGIVVRAGSARDGQRMYLVKFEGPDKTLGPTVACLEDELTKNHSESAPDPS
jgi:hypothetical protein